MDERFKGKHMLILEGYARQCLSFMKSFKKMGCEVTLLCGSKLDLGYWPRYPDHKSVGICDPERFKANPPWFRIRNTYDQTISWTDPLPCLIRGVRKLDKELKERGWQKRKTSGEGYIEKVMYIPQMSESI